MLVVRVLRPPVGLEVTVEEGQGAVSTEHVRPPSPEGRRADAQERTFNPRLISIASVTGATPRVQGLVRVAAGPWSLEEGWWRGEPVERDYWDVELSGGGLYRIYRDRRTGDWFADGMYD